MSSTARGGVREASDYYVTPQWAIADFLREFTADAKELCGWDPAQPFAVLDPCAGGNPANERLPARPMAYPEAIRAFPSWNVTRLDTMDIREDSLAEIKHDYLAGGISSGGNFQRGELNFSSCEPSAASGVPTAKWDVVITNPPFSLAMEIIEQSLRDVRQPAAGQCGGIVVMLQRLNFFGGQTDKRAFFDRVGLPVAAYVHRRRIPFMPPGSINPVSGKPFSTDSIEYAHFVWQRGAQPRFTHLRVI